MFIVSLAAALAFESAAQAPLAGPPLDRANAPSIDSEAKRMGVTPLTLRRALRATSNRQRISLDDPLYCFVDSLSVPSAPRRVCHTKAQWANAGFEPILK